MKERQGSIYLLRNLMNGKGYVGQTVCGVANRLKGHVYAAYVKKSRKPLYRAMRRDGVENFMAIELWVGYESELNMMERRFVRQCETFRDTGWGYNLTTGGDHCKLSKQAIRKIRASVKRYFVENPTARENLSASLLQFNKDHPEAGILRGILERAMYVVNPKLRRRQSRKMLAVHAENPELRIHVAEWHRGKPLTAKHRAAISRGNKKPRRPEVYTKISATLTGRPLSAEHKAALSVASRKRWALESEHVKHSKAHLGYKPTAATKQKWEHAMEIVRSDPAYRARLSEAAKKDWARRKAA